MNAEDLIGLVAAEVQPIVRRLLAEPMAPVAKLRDDVEAHLEYLIGEQPRNGSVDLEQARSIAKRCLALLDRLTASGIAAPKPVRRLVQIAARYFVIEDDTDDELAFDGRSADETVITAVELGVLNSVGTHQRTRDVPPRNSVSRSG
jgi:hypothetical protein